MTQSRIPFSQYIDHTLLKPTLTANELKNLCAEARAHQFKTVCVPPTWVKFAVAELRHSGVGTITVVGFPLGYSTKESKAFEAKQAIADGASEIDMVVNISQIKSGMWAEVEADIKEVKNACGTTPLKVIIETAYLTETEKVQAAQIAERAGAEFVKTSTGFATGVLVSGATLEDIQLLRKNLKSTTLIKASGGIKDLSTAEALVKAGANRLGTSSGVAILKGLKVDSEY